MQVFSSIFVADVPFRSPQTLFMLIKLMHVFLGRCWSSSTVSCLLVTQVTSSLRAGGFIGQSKRAHPDMYLMYCGDCLRVWQSTQFIRCTRPPHTLLVCIYTYVLFTKLLHPHEHWHLQALLGNSSYRKQSPRASVPVIM